MYVLVLHSSTAVFGTYMFWYHTALLIFRDICAAAGTHAAGTQQLGT